MGERVTVAMAAYQGERFLLAQLDSIRAQTRVPDECIVIDDHSADHTVQLLRDYQMAHPDFPLVVLCNEENVGYRENFRRALLHGTGDYLFLADQDDVWAPHKIQHMLDVMKRHPAIQVLASSFAFIDARGKRLPNRHRPGWSNQNLYHARVKKGALVPVAPEQLILHNFAQGCSLCVTRAARDAYLAAWTPDMPHDWLLSLIGAWGLAAGKGTSCAAAAGSGTWFLNERLFSYRLHGGNTLGVQRKAAAREKLTPAYRLFEAKEARGRIDWVLAHAPQAAAHSARLMDISHFLVTYQEAMEEGRGLQLLGLWFSGSYRELKSVKARGADLAVALADRLLRDWRGG